MKVKIRVTQNHIDTHNNDLSLNSCPISMAIYEQTGLVVEANGRLAKRTSKPKKVSRFISRHDCALPVKPFNFKMHVRCLVKRSA